MSRFKCGWGRIPRKDKKKIKSAFMKTGLIAHIPFYYDIIRLERFPERPNHCITGILKSSETGFKYHINEILSLIDYHKISTALTLSSQYNND